MVEIHLKRVTRYRTDPVGPDPLQTVESGRVRQQQGRRRQRRRQWRRRRRRAVGVGTGCIDVRSESMRGQALCCQRRLLHHAARCRCGRSAPAAAAAATSGSERRQQDHLGDVLADQELDHDRPAWGSSPVPAALSAQADQVECRCC